MVQVEIVIRAEPTVDTEVRDFAKQFDTDYIYPWREEDYLLTPEGEHFTTDSEFEHTQTKDLDIGTHRILFIVGSSPTLYWKAEILINGVSLGVQENLYNDVPYDATFDVTAPPKTLAESMSEMINMMMSLMMLIMVMQMMTGMMKGLKK